MATQPRRLATLNEYLEAERLADHKSEYHDGEIFGMSGGTFNHSLLSVRLITILARLLDSCKIFDSNLRLYLEQTRQCVYPDAMVLCGHPEFLDNRKDVLLNPILVVEVLSPSTQAYDRGIKALSYRTIPSLRHCLLISQDRPNIEHPSRDLDGTWLINEYTGCNATIPLTDLSIELSTAEIYRNIL